MAFESATKAAIQEISRGAELTCRLQPHIHHHPHASDLSGAVLRSLSAALALLGSANETAGGVPQDGRPANKGPMVAPARDNQVDARLAKRRKQKNNTVGSDSWTTTTTPYLDGYQWRKYGQKKINNSKHPRCYYRCTHKEDRGCPAMKLVQQESDGGDGRKPMFRVMYNNKHTCNLDSSDGAPAIFASSLDHEQPAGFFIFESNSKTESCSSLVNVNTPPSVLQAESSAEEGASCEFQLEDLPVFDDPLEIVALLDLLWYQGQF